MKWMFLAMLLLAVPLVNADIISPTADSIQNNVTASANFTESTIFEVFVDGASAHVFTNTTQFNQMLSLSDGSHTIIISINGTNTTINNVTQDSAAPSISGISFTPQYAKAGTQVNISFTITEANLASATVALEDVNGNLQVPSAATAGSNSVSITIPSAGTGQTYLNITATDSIGRAASSKTLAAIIDNTIPTVSIVNPASKIFASGSFKANYTYTEQNPDKIIISLVGASQPGTISITANGTITREDTISVSSISDGIYALNITIIDKLGNSQSDIKSGVIVVDNSKPNVTFMLTGNTSSIIRVHETVTPICTGSDNAQQWGGSFTTNISGTVDTSRTELGSVFCTITDSAGNKLTKEIQYDVLPAVNSTTSTNSTVIKTVTTTPSQSTAPDDILHMVNPNSGKYETSATESAEASASESGVESNASELPPAEDSAPSKTWPWIITSIGILAVIGIGGWIWYRKRDHPFTRGIKRNEPPELVLNIRKPNMEEYK